MRVILHLVDPGGLYGIERMVLALLPRLKEHGLKPVLLCLGSNAPAAEALCVYAERVGVQALNAGMGLGIRPSGFIRALRCYQSIRPSAVHVHGYKATVVGTLLARLSRVPVVGTYHAEAFRAVGIQRQLAVETPFLRCIDAVVAVSPAICEDLVARGVKSERIRHIPNGVPAELLPPRPLNPKARILFVGRLVDEKNVQLAIDALAVVARTFADISLEVAGDGPLRGALEDYACSLGVESRVRFLGFVDDLSGRMASADVFLMTSRTEGMPMALLEAVAAGLPIVATAVGSIPEVVRNEAEALLVPSGDLSALVAALFRILNNPDEAQRRARAAQLRFAANYTADAMAMHYAELYEDLFEDALPTMNSGENK